MKTSMKAVWTGLVVGLLSLGSSQGAMYTYTSTPGELIPDYNLITSTPGEWADQITVSGLSGLTIADVDVRLTLSGGWNGDLYAYLSYAPSGGGSYLVPLLNRVGTGSGSEPQYTFGFSTAGFANVRMDDEGANGNIHGVAVPGSSPTYSYTPDGGALSLFDTKNANGTWTLYLADLSSGSQSTVDSWSVDITAVPEPAHVALGIFGGVLALGGLVRSGRLRGWLSRPTAL